MKCISCEKEAEDVCGDGYCRECHVSLSFEDCCDGTWVERMTTSLKTINSQTIIDPNKRLRKGYRKTIPLSEWLKRPTLFGLPIIESDKIKDHGEIKFGDFSEYIRKVEP
jgi:hypothetical protein